MKDSSASDNFGLHVLIAEDNPVNQMVAEKILHKLGCTCCVVSNGQEAIERLSEDPYDLILMDCMMPELDGLEATRRIRAANNVMAKIPIIAFTANAMSSDEEACFEAGMNDFLPKPVTLAEMKLALAKWSAQIKGA